MEDKKMILSPELWPKGPILPMTRLDGSKNFGKELGIIFKGDLNIVRLTDMFSVPQTAHELNRVPCIIYDSIDAMLADGWVVD